jgi:DNA-binding XRE family transcriptional regulator
MASDTTPARRVRMSDLSPELQAKLAERRAKAIADRHLEGPPPNVTGEPIFFFYPLRTAVLALRKAREAAGLSVADVAAKCGVTEDELTQLEAGAFLNPTWKLLGDYAHAIGAKLSLAVEPAA